jgi:hypothetical protein
MDVFNIAQLIHINRIKNALNVPKTAVIARLLDHFMLDAQAARKTFIY